MRRFRVKDLLISPYPAGGGGGGVGLLAGPCKPARTDRPCAEGWTENHCVDAETKDLECKEGEITLNLPCKDKSNTTPCAVNGDTTIDCAKGDVTYLPCLKKDATKGKCSPDPGIPNADKTKFRCYDNPATPPGDTKGVCRGGTHTATPGWTPSPWHGCFKDATSKKACADDSDTKYECWKSKEKEDLTRYECQDNSDTDNRCKGPTTSERCLVYTCAYGHTDFAVQAVPGGGPGGLLDRLPLSPLHLPVNHPLAVDALQMLRSDLRVALGYVEYRQDQVASYLELHTSAEAADVESHLERALGEVRDLKRRLPAQAPTEPAPPKKAPRRK